MPASKIDTNHQPITKDWVTGAALMIRRELFESVKGFDERYFMYFEDIDLCKRVKSNGYGILYYPKTSLVHLGGKSYQKKDSNIVFEYRRSQLRFYDKQLTLVQRILVRIYLFTKYLPAMFSPTHHGLGIRVLKLIFHWQY